VDKDKAAFTYCLDREKLRRQRRREGRYLLRTNLTEADPAKLWSLYLQLVNVEEAFKNLKGDLAVRPIFHQSEKRIEAHILISFLAYCLHITLTERLRSLAPGLTARSALEKFAAMQMIDVHLPTTDGRELILTRTTQPEPELLLLLDKLKLQLPQTTSQDHPRASRRSRGSVVQTLVPRMFIFQLLNRLTPGFERKITSRQMAVFKDYPMSGSNKSRTENYCEDGRTSG